MNNLEKDDLPRSFPGPGSGRSCMCADADGWGFGGGLLCAEEMMLSSPNYLNITSLVQ